MHKIGLKLWSNNIGICHDEALRLYRERGFDYIELYVLPGSSEQLPDWRGLLPVPFVIHAPHSQHGFNLADRSKRSENRKMYETVRHYADELKADFIIFHGGTDGTIGEVAHQLGDFNEPRALIENKPAQPLPTVAATAHRCRGFNPEEIGLVMNNTGCGFCLDIGHAICAANKIGTDREEFLEQFLELHPRLFHLSDMPSITGVLDSHLGLGDGVLPLIKIIGQLPPDAEVTLETPRPAGLIDFNRDVSCYRRHEVTLRRAETDDMERLFRLSNDPEVRRNSFCSDRIEMDAHVRWFTRKLAAPDVVFMIAENAAGELVGQVRFEPIGERTFLVGISVVEQFRGRGAGELLLKRGASTLFDRYPDATITAEIKTGNLASRKLFARAGYVSDRESSDEKLRYVLKHE